MYTVGQLSKRTNVSIRTLHYYEQLGLIRPIRDAQNGYRLYGGREIRRLQQIAILKHMNFTLREIAAILEQDEAVREHGSDHEAAAWTRMLETQLSVVRKRQEELRRVERLLHSVLYAIRVTGQVDHEEMLSFIKELERSRDDARDARLAWMFTPEELKKLPIDNFEPAVMAWADILREVRQHLHEPPESEASRKLAGRILDYIKTVFGDDEQLVEKYWAYITPEDGRTPRVYGMTPDVMRYIERILEKWG